MSAPEQGVRTTEQPAPEGVASPTPTALSAVVVVSVFCVVVWGLWVLVGGGPGRAPRPDLPDE